MKKGLLSFLVGALFASGSMTAQNVAMEVIGDYKGDLYVALGEEVSPETEAAPDQTVNLAAGSKENTVTLSLHNFSFGTTPVGDIEVPDVPVVKDADGNITFGENPVLSLELVDGSILATVQINTANSVIKGDSLIAKIDVIWTGLNNEGTVTPMDIPINVLFKGKKEGISNISMTDVSPSAIFYNLHTGKLNMPAGEQYQVYNIAGQLVKSGRAASNAVSLDDLRNGLYLVKVGKVTTKIVKK